MAGHSLLTIRDATPDDTGLILSFVRELADYEKLLHEVTADEATLHKSLFNGNPSAWVLIAELGEDAAGFALFHEMFSTFIARPGIYLEDLYVRPQFRGRGIGNALLVHLAKQTVDGGYCRLDWSVLKWNESAIRFYQGIEARELDDWTRFRLDGAALAVLAGVEGRRKKVDE